MLLVDKDIQVFCNNGNLNKIKLEDLTPKDQTAIFKSHQDCITNIGYDLRAFEFYTHEDHSMNYDLLPGESVIVVSKETVHFDEYTSGSVQIKNSRLRMGLSVEAPMYQPGHTTPIYFRLTNISGDIVKLKANEQYATLFFYQLHQSPVKPYDGAFQKEFSFKGLADYTSQYKEQIKKLNKKEEDIRTTEKGIYGNVITILSIFIAIFSLINVNIELVATASEPLMILMFNLSIIGAISLFSLFVHNLMFKEERKWSWLWLVPIACLICIGIIIYLLSL